MRCQNLRLLLGEQFMNRQGKVMLEGFVVRLDRLILALFRRLEQAVIARPELCLQVTPRPMDRAPDGARFLYIRHPRAMQLVLKLCAKIRALQALRQKIAFERNDL